MNEIIKKYNNTNIISNISSNVHINGRKNLIKRCINNLIDNGIKYGDKVNVELLKVTIIYLLRLKIMGLYS